MPTRSEIPEKIDREAVPEIDRAKLSPEAAGIVAGKREAVAPLVRAVAAQKGEAEPTDAEIEAVAYRAALIEREDQINRNLAEAARLNAEIDDLRTERAAPVERG